MLLGFKRTIWDAIYEKKAKEFNETSAPLFSILSVGVGA